MTLNDAFINALVTKRHDDESRELLRRSLRIRRERKRDPKSRFHSLPEPQRREDLRLIEL